jgi:hypothetical protein
MVELTEGELFTIHRLCDYIISKREHFNIVASGKDGIIARAEALDEKVSKILWPGDSI